MYTFIIKENGPGLDFIATRALLALAAIAALVYRTDHHYFVNILVALLLFSAAVFIRIITVKFHINKFVLSICAAAMLLIATRSLSFAVVLLVYGYLVRFLNQQPSITFTKDGICVKKLLSTQTYHWVDFANIILKDTLLTLDFKSNKLIQVTLSQQSAMVDENAFNNFCSELITTNTDARYSGVLE